MTTKIVKKSATKKTDAENKDLCANCDSCCRYIAVEIDKPRAKNDWENIRWFLLHENVRVYVDWDNSWYLEFMTPCKALDKRGLCTVYAKRPKMCRDYTQDNCTHYNNDPAEKIYLKSVADLDKYLKNRR